MGRGLKGQLYLRQGGAVTRLDFGNLGFESLLANIIIKRGSYFLVYYEQVKSKSCI